MSKQIKISGVGCCLVDRLYSNLSFASSSFLPNLSKEKGDGGLIPGQLVLEEDFTRFRSKSFSAVIKEITAGKAPDKINIGGPSIVSLIHAVQLLDSKDCICKFYGCRGKDTDGDFLFKSLHKTPVNIDNYKLVDAVTPSTIVLSDPSYDHGSGERIFVNTIGAAWNFTPEDLNEEFFKSDIVVFGGTALMPNIHDNLTELLEKAKSNGCITVVNTVFDFRNEKADPSSKWPLGKSDDSYKNIDLLITDFEEALRLSGKSSINESLDFFRKNGASAVIATNGSGNIRLYSNGSKLFKELNYREMPVSAFVADEVEKRQNGDTTGCGDNFVGGVIASLVTQLQKGDSSLDLTEACMWGTISGGFACFYIGGTYFEKYPGEKRGLIIPYYNKYKNQIL
jgi:sugar/nucleoside kinase (ribokinase family)